MLGMLTMLLAERSFEAGFFRHLSNRALRIRNFGNTKAVRVIFFFFKYSKFNLDLKNAAKSWQKLFCFSDNCIWIGIVKMSLFRTGYFSSVANVLTRYPQIWYVNKGDFFEKNFLASDQRVWYSCYDIAVACLGTSTILLVEASSETWIFRDLSDSDFEVCNFQNTKSMRVIFRFKMSKT